MASTQAAKLLNVVQRVQTPLLVHKLAWGPGATPFGMMKFMRGEGFFSLDSQKELQSSSSRFLHYGRRGRDIN